MLVVEPSQGQSGKSNIRALRLIVSEADGHVHFQLQGREATNGAHIPRRFYNLSVHLPGQHSLWNIERGHDGGHAENYVC